MYDAKQFVDRLAHNIIRSENTNMQLDFLEPTGQLDSKFTVRKT